MEVNKEAIDKTIALIKKASANKIKMSSWFSDGKGVDIPESEFNPHKCKTTACIAGWVQAANPKKTDSIYLKMHTSTYAQYVLNISGEQSTQLFYSCVDGFTPAKRKKAVIKVLENLRDTGKVKWEY